MSHIDEKSEFSPYRPDGKLYGFICVVTGADQPVGQAITLELAGKLESSSYGDTEAELILLRFTAHGAACIYGKHTS